LLLVTVALAACGGSESAEPAAVSEEIVVDMEDIYFGETNDNVDDPPLWTVTSGAEVTVRMDNAGALEHSWVILEAGEDIPLAYEESQDGDKVLFSSGTIAAGDSAEVVFTAPDPGEYNVLCTIPGHSAIMQGRLIVVG
jgi:uncharacterized cupredoxin-like copper-binding protein